MDRRDFISLVVGTIIAAPLAVHAQQAERVYRIGLLSASSESAAAGVEAFREGLRTLG